MQSEDLKDELVGHYPCTKCGSKDNVAVYRDDHGFCFGCSYRYRDYWQETDIEQEERDETPTPKVTNDFLPVTTQAFGARGIDEATVKKFNCGVSKIGWVPIKGSNKKKVVYDPNGIPVQVYQTFIDGKLAVQQWKSADKKFGLITDPSIDIKSLPFFGAHLWTRGKKIVVTEGHLDALSVSKIQDNKWPTVSIPNGTEGAVKAFKANLEYFDQFDQVVLMFDMDEPGQKAALACAELLRPGHAAIARLPLKDPNECLMKGKSKDVYNAIWDAKPYRPDGIITGEDLWSEVERVDPPSDAHYPYPKLDNMLQGLRGGEIITFTAGSGQGKSTICREIAHSLLKQDKKVGLLFLEESPKKTLNSIIGIELDKPLHQNGDLATKEEKRAVYDELLSDGRVAALKHFGSADMDSLMSRIRYMVVGLGCDYIILDHITIAVSGLETNDERKLIDVFMTRIRTLVEELGFGMLMVTHLRKADGDEGFEDGKRVTLNVIRGSHSIVQLSDGMVVIQSYERPLIEILKNRPYGVVGEADYLSYNPDTGRLLPDTKPPESPFKQEVKNKDF